MAWEAHILDGKAWLRKWRSGMSVDQIIASLPEGDKPDHQDVCTAIRQEVLRSVSSSDSEPVPGHPAGFLGYV